MIIMTANDGHGPSALSLVDRHQLIARHDVTDELFPFQLTTTCEIDNCRHKQCH